MEFGDKGRFAIEVELDENCGGSWLFGRICYWVGGSVVGDYDAGTSLRDVLFQMKYIVGDRGRRKCPLLMQLPEMKVVDMISAALSETSDELCKFLGPNSMPASLDVRIPVDVFDSWRIFLIENAGAAKLICFDVGSSSLKSVLMSEGEFDSVFSDAYAYLDKVYQSMGNHDLG